ncbi:MULTISPECIES: fluoride efflux transporter CrcB [Aeribacillus]|jgi:CrcB protein|uniref:Fluoride-specific ion channel FluC n=1 Tax=Aeribacillus pallidus TaxID=33936 RepID=A0A165YF85_9BACI|nr:MULTISPECIES: fluoride efflux transporter CrcB [Aeribacillus]KZN97012.1 hypothetical protein AZI98_05460 [Aeribacillus pallidus]MED1439132.1 fluoride efflux transporter CrcB [Aeribacillus composti]TVZ86107.1 camphor resistance protein CrcB [Aeribacillus composti]
MIYLLVGLGGIAGACLRYSVGLWTSSFWTGSFPAATLLANLAGSFLLGWLTEYVFKIKGFPPHFAAAIGTGLIGSFTTFSTFSFENIQLMIADKWETAIMYTLSSLIGGYLFVSSGYHLGRKMLSQHNARTARHE